jgi:serpin B
MFSARTQRVLGLGLVASGLLLAACSSSDSSDNNTTPTGMQEAKSEKVHDQSPQVADADYAVFIGGANDFGFDLYKQLTKTSGNFFYSPLSTTSALAMTYAGAKGDTASQMATMLHNSGDPKVFHASMNKLLLDLDKRNVAEHTDQDGKKSVKLLPVNQAWGQQNYAINSDYLDTLAVNYGAGLNLLDFISDPDGSRVTINNWVGDKTSQRILNLIPEGAITGDTRLVLTNALYFYGSWATPFDVNSTAKANFQGSDGVQNVDFMHQTGGSGYAEGDGYKAASLAYDQNKLSMVIILPDAGKLADVRSSMTSAWLAKLNTSMSSSGASVSFALPKFKFTWGTQSFKEPLTALGLKDAFVLGQADFSGIEPKRELYVSNVFHKAFVGIDESGTEAAAATAVVIEDSSAPLTPKDFTVDRPFIFLIQDSSGIVLFVGEVSKIVNE